MRISELGQRVGVSARTVRHYENLGLLTGRRSSNGYREYDESDLRLLEEVRSLVDLGFTLEETKPFLDCLRSGHQNGGSCPDSLAVYSRKLAEVDHYLALLQETRERLQSGYRQAAAARAEHLYPDDLHGCTAPQHALSRTLPTTIQELLS